MQKKRFTAQPPLRQHVCKSIKNKFAPSSDEQGEQCVQKPHWYGAFPLFISLNVNIPTALPSDTAITAPPQPLGSFLV